MATVFTPNALVQSGYRKILLQDLFDNDCDEVCIFQFPSPNLIDRKNGDGRLLEVWDYARDFSWISVEGTEIDTTPETEVWVR